MIQVAKSCFDSGKLAFAGSYFFNVIKLALGYGFDRDEALTQPVFTYRKNGSFGTIQNLLRLLFVIKAILHDRVRGGDQTPQSRLLSNNSRIAFNVGKAGQIGIELIDISHP